VNPLLHYQIDSRAAAPAYRQLMAQVAYYVASGALVPGAQLPSIRALARYLGVNPSTVVKAYAELEVDQVVESRQGSGVFVRAGAKVPTVRQRQAALRERARTLVVEASQMGADRELVLRIVAEELAALEHGIEPRNES